MMTPLALLVFGILTTGFSDEPQVTWQIRAAEGQLILSVSNCAEPDDNGTTFTQNRKKIHELLSGLAAWKAKLGEQVAKVLPSIETTSTGACSAVIDDVIPTLLKELNNAHPEHGGPNCWNAALVGTKLIPALRHTTAAEFNFWLRSPLCRIVQDHETLEAGDIAALRKHKDAPYIYTEWHGFVYIAEGIAFSKNGRDKRQNFRILDTAEILQTYEINPKNAACLRKNVEKPEGCEKWITYYRCQPIGTYLKEKQSLMSPRVKQARSTLHKFELALQKYLMKNSASLPKELADEYARNLNEIKIESNSMLGKISGSDDAAKIESLMWQMIGQTAQSLIDQTKLATRP